ncbi:1,4-alpha-glucan branching protein domain-containing protein [Salinithrix halophila]|uniref:1,4-alpha-glucan branching protein domain-containing protein n=1 Tax=Salinithrix halophila TaxID=1485204 RepID=A0ABV8JIB5_9BACL
MESGYLALVLHAHLPYTRHPERKHTLEERWLFEAITETYIPLLQVFQGLLRDGADFRLTFSISPTLLSMWTDDLLKERVLRYLNQSIDLAEKEVDRTRKDPVFHRLANYYRERLGSIHRFWRHYNGDLVRPFRELADRGKLELITSAGTHPFLPFVKREESIHAQLRAALTLHEHHFGRKSRGIWLPECGYAPDLDRLLQENGIDYFFTDSHGLALAEPAPVFDLLSPVLTPKGTAVFARDPAASEQVWSSKEGYPGDYDYREYYRDIGYDLDFETIRPYIHPEGIRINTGFKYYRITGPGEHKEPYNLEWAREKTARHADHFLWERRCQVREGVHSIGRKPVVTAPYDAELYGHWWFEGPQFLDMLFRKMHFDQDELQPITPSEYLDRYGDYQVCRLAMSTWGRHGYADVWLNGTNDWIYPVLHRSEERLVALALRFDRPSSLERRALNQAGRELMLAQASDWAFIMDNKTMVEYAVKRTKHHINRFECLMEMLEAASLDEEWIAQAEALTPLFPQMDYRWYRPLTRGTVPVASECPRVLMLAWEFPPMMVGGLSRHVYDLSRALVKKGWEVHVVTTEIGDDPHTEMVEGIHVHRVHVMKPCGDEFYHWVFQLNLMMVDTVHALMDTGLSFDIIHAHDWLVSRAAKALKYRLGSPLVSTIHATEHGRNQGIHTDLQHRIHSLEQQLIDESDRVILCSTYMKREVEQIFHMPSDKAEVLPNGVDPELIQVADGREENKEPFAMVHERIVLFIGRLVREKGVETLIRSAERVLSRHPDTKFVIAGKGPMKEEWEELSRQLNLADKVLFTGFISDEARNRLLRSASVAVFPSWYEPFGIVALEAMAAGTPVVVSDTGGLADVVEHGYTGLKAYPQDVHSLALQINTILSDPEQAAGFAQRAKEELSRFDWNRIANGTISLYEKILPRDCSYLMVTRNPVSRVREENACI